MLFDTLNAPMEAPAELETSLRAAITGTSIEEMLSLYAVARYGYSGNGRIVDIGCGPGGSTFALARGLADNTTVVEKRPVLGLDIFDGYCRMIARKRFPDGDRFRTDVEVFEHVNRTVRDLARPVRTDLTKGFETALEGAPIEIAHVDAAKSLDLWIGICGTLRHAIIPGKTILIFQDFERARLPFQVYGLQMLRPYGEIIGGSPFGTVYFRIEKEIPQTVWDVLVEDSLSVEERLAATEAMYSHALDRLPDIFEAPYPAQELKQAALAYCHLYGGDMASARELYNSLSRAFRHAPENALFQRDFEL